MRKLILLLSLTLIFFSCKKEEETIYNSETNTDLELYQKAKATTNFSWYKNIDSLFKKSSGSGHGQAYFKTRFNAIAASKLTSEGKVQNNASFPEGSLIVKELYADEKSLDLYAILFKDSKNVDADAKGWVWGYIRPGGNVAVSASKKGSSCINCHSQSENIDYVLMNKFYP
jgi:hypothetical protein